MRNAITKPIYVGNTDPVEYNEQAILFMQTGQFIDDHWPVGFTIILGSIYKLFGPNYSIFKFLNILLFISIPILFYRNISHFFRIKSEKLFLLIFLLFLLFDPEFSFYSSTLYKELIFIFLTLLSLTITINVADTKNSRKTSYYAFWGLILAVATAINSQINTWFIAPLFAWLLLSNWRRSNTKDLLSNIKRQRVFFSTFLISFLSITVLVGLNFKRSTGNFHLFPTNGIFILFLNNSPNGCEGVEFTTDNGICKPNYDFIRTYASEKGVDYNQLSPFKESELKKEYIFNYLLNNPKKIIERIVPFMQFWLIPNLEWSQRTIINKSYLLYYLWGTYLLASLGLVLAIIQKKIQKGWIHIGIFYFFCSICYMMAFYLMRYKMYYRLFELLLCSYAVHSLLISLNRKFFKEKIVNFPLIPMKYLIILFVASFVYLWSYFKPLFALRHETSYNILIEQLKNMSASISIQKFNLKVPKYFGIEGKNNSSLIELSPFAGNVVKSGLVELYPGGEILFNEDGVREWAAKELGGVEIKNVTPIDTTQEGYQPVGMTAGDKKIKFEVFIKDGFILPPDFREYFVNTKTAVR